MHQRGPEAAPVRFDVTIDDASTLPIHHVNALAVRISADEFFFTLGTVIPPDRGEMEAAVEAGHLVAQPVFRFAVSRETMAKFLVLMVGQYDQQTTLINQLQGHTGQTNEEEANRDE
jgi:hypothetical protein